ncbi:MAG TPA: hypothetical protein DCS29_02430 [Candidatus Magasanikbacteria bacterium]|nr:MAG: hypothetical protein A2479_01830 [Candidatus Magasanikbacteria bacterium RIFOXYC2_FULL_39_8]HAT03613.1 hypothetical protein [Candidatus Magasanikbacteria bacterium]
MNQGAVKSWARALERACKRLEDLARAVEQAGHDKIAKAIWYDADNLYSEQLKPEIESGSSLEILRLTHNMASRLRLHARLRGLSREGRKLAGDLAKRFEHAASVAQHWYEETGV